MTNALDRVALAPTSRSRDVITVTVAQALYHVTAARALLAADYPVRSSTKCDAASTDGVNAHSFIDER